MRVFQCYSNLGEDFARVVQLDGIKNKTEEQKREIDIYVQTISLKILGTLSMITGSAVVWTVIPYLGKAYGFFALITGLFVIATGNDTVIFAENCRNVANKETFSAMWYWIKVRSSEGESLFEGTLYCHIVYKNIKEFVKRT